MASFEGTVLSDDAMTVTLNFTTDEENPLPVNISVADLNVLITALLNAGNAAEQKRPRLPKIDTTIGQMVADYFLNVDEWRTTTADQMPNAVLLHLLIDGGLVQTLSFQKDQAQFVGESLQSVAGQQTTPSTEKH